MNFLSDKRRRRIFIITASAVTALAIIAITCTLYLGDYYRADNEAIGTFMPQGSNWKEEPDGTVVFEPEGAAKGFIFYPGGKVEYTAYVPLMQACAEKGILCVLIEMPFNLAVFDVNAAEGVQELYPNIEKWYIGGHSLGGSMAAAYLKENVSDFEGLILLGSYSTADLSESDLEVLSIYRGQHRLLNLEKYLESKSNLYSDLTEIVIDGGCHAYFGMYGAQEGDGIPAISNEEQIERTTREVVDFIF